MLTSCSQINNAIGQVLLARRIGKKRIIAETGAGQHGVATATVCAKFGLECVPLLDLLLLNADSRFAAARFTWEKRTFVVKLSTSSECECSEPRSSRSLPVPERSRTPSVSRIVFAVESKLMSCVADEAMRDWVTNLATTHYMVGSAIGPHPFPTIVRDFQSVIGSEIKSQLAALTGKLPDAVIACVGGGSNAMGCARRPSPTVSR